MEQTISPAEWFEYAASRWRFLLTAVTCAIAITFVISVLLPRRYTATVTLIIDPPPGNDPRAGVAVNPTYLESLRTFEHFFTTDTLFQQAVDRFHLGKPTDSIASLRRRMLKVSKLRETRILEVSATLPDPKTAQDLVQFIADQSVAASREEASGTDRQFQEQTSALASTAGRNLQQAQEQWSRAIRDGGPESIETELEAAIASLGAIRRQEADAAAESAEWAVRAREGEPENRRYAEVQARSAAARSAEYRKREQELAAEISSRRRLLGTLTGSRDAAQANVDSAQTAYDAALAKVRDLSAQLGTRGEALRIIDRGVMPRKPSFPNVLLNVAAAGLLSLCMAAAWVTVSLNRSRRHGIRATISDRAA